MLRWICHPQPLPSRPISSPPIATGSGRGGEPSPSQPARPSRSWHPCGRPGACRTGAGLWQLRDNGLVGAARTGYGVELRVRPKTPIGQLLYLPGYAQNPRGLRPEDVDAGERPDLLPALAHAFARAAERALRQGVLLGYRETEEALPVVRGRIRMTDQLRRRHGLPAPVEVR